MKIALLLSGELRNGDLYYDLAKLNHNLTVNHDIVGKNLFNHVVPLFGETLMKLLPSAIIMESD